MEETGPRHRMSAMASLDNGHETRQYSCTMGVGQNKLVKICRDTLPHGMEASGQGHEGGGRSQEGRGSLRLQAVASMVACEPTEIIHVINVFSTGIQTQVLRRVVDNTRRKNVLPKRYKLVGENLRQIPDVRRWPCGAEI